VTDEEIVQRIQLGDRRLFEELHRRYYARIWRFARRTLLNDEAATDIASETFIRAYRSIDRYQIRRDGGFPAFLFRIARNLMTDMLRKMPPQPPLSLDGEENLQERLTLEGEGDPLEIALREERRRRVREALARLPEADRQVILLAYEADLSRREVAVIMGKPSVTAVTSHLHRALNKLRQLLLQDEYFQTEQRGDSNRVEILSPETEP
jgi:RNA polymerase sigma-70 factor (ECF subfamily)